MQGVDGAGLRLVGVAAGAPVTDLAANLRQASDANARAFLTALATDSWSQYYGVPLRIGSAHTPGIIQRMARNCVSVDKTPQLGTLLGILALRQDLGQIDLGRTPPWAPALRRTARRRSAGCRSCSLKLKPIRWSRRR